MTREETKELLPIMQAFAEGKIIEYKFGNEWLETNCPVWTRDSEYRIKSEPKYRPFKNQEECWNEMLKHQPFGWIKCAGKYINIIGLSETAVELSPDEVDRDFDLVKNSISFDYMFQSFVFADGTPFGIKEE